VVVVYLLGYLIVVAAHMQILHIHTHILHIKPTGQCKNRQEVHLVAKENRALMRRTKGWKGFVRSYNNYITNGSYDKVTWGKGSQKPKSVTKDKMGREIQTW
jgi:hypothetical protein